MYFHLIPERRLFVQVTCPKQSATLHTKSSSADKTLLTYPGAWHCLLAGEYDDISAKVFQDIVRWIDERCSESSRSNGASAVGSGLRSSSRATLPDPEQINTSGKRKNKTQK